MHFLLSWCEDTLEEVIWLHRCWVWQMPFCPIWQYNLRHTTVNVEISDLKRRRSGLTATWHENQWTRHEEDGKPFLQGHKGCSITHNGPTLLLPKVIYKEQALLQANLLCWYNSPQIIAHAHSYTGVPVFPTRIILWTPFRLKVQGSRFKVRIHAQYFGIAWSNLNHVYQ